MTCAEKVLSFLFLMNLFAFAFFDYFDFFFLNVFFVMKMLLQTRNTWACYFLVSLIFLLNVFFVMKPFFRCEILRSHS